MPATGPTSIPNQRPGSWPWLRERLFPRGTNLIQITSYVILLSLIIIQVLTPASDSPAQNNATLLALVVLLIIQIVIDDLIGLFPGEELGRWVWMIISTALTFYIVGFGNMYSALYILFMIAAQVNATIKLRQAILFTVLVSVAFLGLLMIKGATMPELSGTGIGLLIGMTFTATLSQVLQRYSEQTRRANELLEQLKVVNTELLEARQKEKELVIAEERLRMARDLHDGLGHHLTALSIQLQAAEKMIEAKPELAVEAVRNARGEVQASLKEVRQSVAALRETPVEIQNLPQTIAKLVEECGKRAGLRTRFEQSGSPADLTPAAAMTLFRTAQEGLTNVQKHAGAASLVRVHLVYEAENVRLEVEDDGQASDHLAAGEAGRFGLAGLRERALLLGGALTFGPRPEGGFRLEISLPVKGEVR